MATVQTGTGFVDRDGYGDHCRRGSDLQFTGRGLATAQSGVKLQFSDTVDSLSALNDTTSITVEANKLAFTTAAQTLTAGVAS